MGVRKSKASKKSTKKVTKRRVAPPEVELEIEDEYEAEEEITTKVLQDRVFQLEREKRHRDTGETLIKAAITDVWVNNRPLVLDVPPRPKLNKSKKNNEIAAVLLSDIHYGKTTPTFNSMECDRRLQILADKVQKITELRRHHANITELRLYMGGDMLEGEDIFPHQPHVIDKNLLEQACRSGIGMYLRFILRLLQDFEKIKIVCVPGNHGRNGPRKTRSHPLTNWDRVLYDMLKVALCGHPEIPRNDLEDRIELIHEDKFYAVDHIGEWGVLLVHGDQIRGGHAGFPYYGVGKKVWGWSEALQDYEGIPESWDYLFFGHFHTLGYGTINLREWYANGSIESHNTFAQENLGQSGTPAQWLFFFDEEVGLIDQNPLYVLHETRKSDIRRAAVKSRKFFSTSTQ